MYLISAEKYPILAQNIRLLPKITQSLPEFSRFLAKYPILEKMIPLLPKMPYNCQKKPVFGKKHPILDTEHHIIAK